MIYHYTTFPPTIITTKQRGNYGFGIVSMLLLYILLKKEMAPTKVQTSIFQNLLLHY
jgi:hypothetical protein